MTLIDGKATAAAIKQEIAEEVKQIVADGGKQPHLAAILVGHDGGSETYVKNKVLACEAVPKSKKLLKFTLDDGSDEKRTILSGIHAYYEPEELVGKTCIAITNLPPRAMMGIESCGMLISAVHHEGEEEKLHLLMVDPHIPAGAKLY
jgi:methionine--tRNA ligase beta chain